MMTTIPSLIFLLIGGLAAMAFLTLTERKLLSYAQMRKGPNKPSYMGMLIPLADAAKLLSKDNLIPYKANKMMFYLSPIMMLTLAMTLWTLTPIMFSMMTMKYTLVMFIIISSMSVYAVLIASWGSNSKYALLGTMRSIAQTISYEVSMALIIISIIQFGPNFTLTEIYMNMPLIMSILNMIIFIMWMAIIMAELNRTPFDLVEGESELVSGFNIEYSSSMFTLIFMSEYLNIVFMSMMTVMITMFSTPLSYINSFMYVVLISYMLVVSRATYPRMRYDMMMNLNWQMYLPLVLMLLMFFSSIIY